MKLSREDVLNAVASQLRDLISAGDKYLSVDNDGDMFATRHIVAPSQNLKIWVYTDYSGSDNSSGRVHQFSGTIDNWDTLLFDLASEEVNRFIAQYEDGLEDQEQAKAPTPAEEIATLMEGMDAQELHFLLGIAKKVTEYRSFFAIMRGGPV